MKAIYGNSKDIDSWMSLIETVSWNFPGLETEEKIHQHKNTVLKFMKDQRAICVKDDEKVVGVLLFSKKRNLICFLAVLPEYRRMHVATMLLTEAIKNLDNTKNIIVTTFRGNDPKGTAPRSLYRKFGFVEEDLMEEFGYPNQRFILYA